MENEYPFDKAVADYIASLDERRREVLRISILNSQAEDDWPWFAEVIERYQLRDKNSPVRRDINQRIEPDPEGINSRDTSSMPRGEDDDKTRAESPEFHDRPPATD